jgi:hypothetical protein
MLPRAGLRFSFALLAAVRSEPPQTGARRTDGEPTVGCKYWWRAGQLIHAIGDTEDWETTKRLEFQNDALIALTAVRHGATVVTTNAGDFELLAKAINLRVEIVSEDAI